MAVKKIRLFLFLLIQVYCFLPICSSIWAQQSDWHSQGLVKYNLGDFLGAVTCYNHALKSDPDNSDLYVNRGAALFEIKETDQAIADYTRALTINRNHINALKNRGIALCDKQKWAEADADLSRAMQLNLGQGRIDVDLYLSRGLARYGLKKYSEAMADFKTALKTAPDNPTVCNQMAWILSVCPNPALRNGTQALILAQKAVAMAPNPHTLDTLALAYAETGQYETAAAYQKRLIELAEVKKFPIPQDTREKLASFLNATPWRVTSLDRH